METKLEVNHEQQVTVMEEHLDDLIFDLIQTIESLKDMGVSQQSQLIDNLFMAKNAVIVARDVIVRDCG